MLVIDLNMDAGESFGTYRIEQLAEHMIPKVTSVNIACGFHAGDALVMRETVSLAMKHGVAIGAHPGLPDLQGFGRRAMAISADEAYCYVLYQIGAIAAFVRATGGELRHVKPHGALYHMASEQHQLADAVVSAVWDFDRELSLFAPASSQLALAAHKKGLRVVREAFIDRTYEADGRLSLRNQPGAIIQEAGLAAQQAVQIVRDKMVIARDGSTVRVHADTLCIHGDHPHAESILEAVLARLQQEQITCRAPHLRT